MYNRIPKYQYLHVSCRKCFIYYFALFDLAFFLLYLWDIWFIVARISRWTTQRIVWSLCVFVLWNVGPSNRFKIDGTRCAHACFNPTTTVMIPPGAEWWCTDRCTTHGFEHHILVISNSLFTPLSDDVACKLSRAIKISLAWHEHKSALFLFSSNVVSHLWIQILLEARTSEEVRR